MRKAKQKNGNSKPDVSANVKRANYVVGHMRAVSDMLVRGEYCIDVIHQLDAVQAAVAKLRQKVLAGHLDTCVVDSINSNDRSRREKAIGELLKIYEKK